MFTLFETSQSTFSTAAVRKNCMNEVICDFREREMFKQSVAPYLSEPAGNSVSIVL